MVRQMSAAQAAGRGGAYRPEPTAGTAAREVWDLFQAARGQVIVYDFVNGGILTSLRDYYGLDLRSAGRHRWCLVGEWLHDGTYVDYVAQRLPLNQPTET